MKRVRVFAILICLLSGLACTLTSPTPASWSGTPTAQALAKTETVSAQTARAFFGTEPAEEILTEAPPERAPTPTPSPQPAVDGPWLIFPHPSGIGLQAYDVEAQALLDIPLPQPIIATDLVGGLSPSGSRLVIRAGSPQNLDELALYLVEFPDLTVTPITPLLSLKLQRQIVNEESSRAVETLAAVTREDGLSWSPDGRFLAFSAALDNPSSDLYLYDTWSQRVRRLNGLYTHNGLPFWSPGSNWLVSHEFEYRSADQSWKTVNFTAIQVPNYDDQNTLYLPMASSQREELLGWVNAQSFFCFSQTTSGPQRIREVNVDSVKYFIRFDGPFVQAAFNPQTKYLAMILDQSLPQASGNTPGIYGLRPGDTAPQLVRAGDFSRVAWQPGGMFLAGGSSGVFGFDPESTSFFLSEEQHASLSPSGSWLIAWGAGPGNAQGARLYQPPVNAPLQTLLASPVETVLWRPDSKGFFLQSGGALFAFAFPSLNPEEIVSGFSGDVPGIFVWMD